MGLTRDQTANLGTTKGARQLWEAFYDLSQIPRMSKHEADVLVFLKSIAERHGLQYRSDKAGNLVVFRPGTGAGSECEPVIVQAHVDMVCEKESESAHHFLKDPIVFRLDGEWLKAHGTTLGADNGIGAAAGIVLMQQPATVDLPPLELLFTVDEETGLNGAKALDRAQLELKGKRLVNMDSEEWGEVCIGCAGGGHSTISLPASSSKVPDGWRAVRLSVAGLQGGHSGLQAHEGRANAVKLVAELGVQLREAVSECRFASFSGGDKHNAIPRAACAIVYVPSDDCAAGKSAMATAVQELTHSFLPLEPDINVEADFESAEGPGVCLSLLDSEKLLTLAATLPNGVQRMSHVMPGLAETSCNLASIQSEGDSFQVLVSSRSSVTSSLHALRARCRLLAERCSASVEENEIYPGWNPDPGSALTSIVKDIYASTFKLEPKLTAVHAGLECGILNDRLGGGIDMVSFGPTIRGAHSPEERVEVATVSSFWDLTFELMTKALVQAA